MFNAYSQRIRVCIHHADPLVAIGLATVLAEHSDIEVCTGTDMPADVQVILTDYAQGLRHAAQRAQWNAPRGQAPARIFVLTANDRENEVFSALEAGIEGYLELSCDPRDVIDGVRQLARGSRYLCAMAARQIAASITRSTLTKRESDVLALVCAGQSNKAVARVLGITEGTAKAHMKAILSKLDARSRTEAASIAQARGMVRGLSFSHLGA